MEVTRESQMISQTYLKSSLRPGDVFYFMVSAEAKEAGVPDRAGIYSGQREMTIMTPEGANPKEQMTDVPYFVDDTFIMARRYTQSRQ